MPPGAPLTYFNDGGGPKEFFGSDILAKRDFLGSMKDAGIFWGRENNTGIILGIVFFISSNQQSQKRNLLLVWYYRIFLRL